MIIERKIYLQQKVVEAGARGGRRSFRCFLNLIFSPN